ncbi:virulence protein [Fretibacterium sp. OH1220_COT-178]|uniref:virulence protein n=1 Tax=Fretibacterium sp. OH1220_COT-178 TaxID=2491047 RepID=UPI000F5FA370|nr:virulence protein [Fretibacterium sp. OH1220_COT-178]RRD65713.1 virulence protein [Fretibacterium sp. OH1220_COT-178]
MYAIAFDLEVAELKKHYGEPYNGAYQEINKELKKVGFDWTQGSIYLSEEGGNNLTAVYKAINALSRIEWFRNSVRDIRAFKVEDWSDFTDIVKGRE